MERHADLENGLMDTVGKERGQREGSVKTCCPKVERAAGESGTGAQAVMMGSGAGAGTEEVQEEGMCV